MVRCWDNSRGRDEITGRGIEVEGKHSKSDEDRRGYERSGGVGHGGREDGRGKERRVHGNAMRYDVT